MRAKKACVRFERGRSPSRESGAYPFFAATLLLEAGIPDFAASRAYYGYFYVAEALLLSEGLRFSSHGQVVAQYGYHFAREDRMDRRFHRLLDQAFSARQVADYDPEPDLAPGRSAS